MQGRVEMTLPPMARRGVGDRGAQPRVSRYEQLIDEATLPTLEFCAGLTRFTQGVPGVPRDPLAPPSFWTPWILSR